tara:strand:+ start:1388 stop:2611 length:1224 start_codon:yes stop_codon:yes gene_type:complete
MAITINGSANTIAGVAAGGINDNVVDNGTMADNAIDSAEITAGAVDIAHLSASGVGDAKFLRGDNTWQTISSEDSRLTLDNGNNTYCGTDTGSSFNGAQQGVTLYGYKCGESITQGSGNTLIGNACGQDLTTGQHNVAIGNAALIKETTGRDNVAIGRSSLAELATSAGYNTFVGGQSGQDVTTGRDNTAIGFHAGKTLTTGSYNVCLGRYAGSSEIDDESERLYIAWDDTPMSNANTWIYGNDSGACYQGNNSSSWSTTSDQRLKKNITDNTVGLSVIDNVKVRNFKYKQYTKPADTYYTESDTIPAGSFVGDIKVKGQYDTPAASEDTIDLSAFPSGTTAHQVVIGQGDTSTHVGVIAQELEAVCPDCIKTSDKGVKTVNTDELFWHMLNAIKELSTKVKALEAG